MTKSDRGSGSGCRESVTDGKRFQCVRAGDEQAG